MSEVPDAKENPFPSQRSLTTLTFFRPLVPNANIQDHPEFSTLTAEEQANLITQQNVQKYMMIGKDSCIFKTTLSAGAGFALGSFFSLMTTSMAYDDPMRAPVKEGIAGQAKTLLKDAGKGMYRSGKGFGKMGGMFAGTECCIEALRAKNDAINGISAGAIVGAILARSGGPKGMVTGAAGFAAFSAAIEWYMRKEEQDDP